MAYTFTEILAMFFVYAFLGWCTEVAFAAVNSGKFVNRGFLNGPVCPIYGVGVVAVALCLEPVRHNTALLFVGAVIVTSALEWLTGFVLEKIFHARWWDYSELPFNIGGYVCLKFSLMWGLACVLVMRTVHPTVLFLIGLVPELLLRILLAVATAALAADLTVTVLGIRRMQARLSVLTKMAADLRELSDDVGERISENVIAAVDRLEEARDDYEERRDELREKREEFKKQLEGLRRGELRMLKAFPSLRSQRYQDMLDRIREHLKK